MSPGRSAGGSGWRNLAEWMLPLHPGQIVAHSRFALASFALAAIYVDPSQPSRFANLAYGILAVYVAYAAIVAFVSGMISTGKRWALASHFIDVAIFSLLMYLTDGPTSPFFVFFTFAIVSGALHWGWAGAIGTAGALTILFLATGYEQFIIPDGDVNRVIMRVAYLVVTGVLLGYFGAYRQRSGQRLARLAQWPQSAGGSGDNPPLEASLCHAGEVLQAERILVLWEKESQPGICFSHWSGMEYTEDRWITESVQSLVSAELRDTAFMGADPLGSSAFTGSARIRVGRPILYPGLVSSFAIGLFATAPFQAMGFSGRIFVLAPHALTPDILALTEIVAGRIRIEFEHFAMREEIAKSSAALARSRLARDMHDTILQDLTATGFALKAKAETVPPSARSGFDLAVRTISDQQKRIREFVAEIDRKPGAGFDEDVSGALQQTVRYLENRWHCSISLTLDPAGMVLGADIVKWAQLVLSEAVANAVRHGKASGISIAVTACDGLKIEVRDNGLSGAGTGTELQPHSLNRRAEEYGGSCRLVFAENGATLLIEIPKP